MPRKLASSIVGIALILLLSAALLSRIERWQRHRTEEIDFEPPQAMATLIAYDGERFPGDTASGSLRRVGCGDLLVPTKIPVVTSRLSSVLSALTQYDPPAGLRNPLREKGVQFTGLAEGERGKTIVLLEGQPSFGGICDTPRFKAQIEETIHPYTKNFEIRLNGSESAYRCLGDMKGDCR